MGWLWAGSCWFWAVGNGFWVVGYEKTTTLMW